MSTVPNFADPFSATFGPPHSQVRQFNGGGFAQGHITAAGRYGGIRVGTKGKVFVGIAGTSGEFLAGVDIEDDENSGTFYSIAPVELAAGPGYFVIDEAVQGNIPYGAKVWLRVDVNVSNPDPDPISIFWYMGAS